MITKDVRLIASARQGFHPDDQLIVHQDLKTSLDACKGMSMIFLDLVITLSEPHKIAGYERFAQQKMDHPVAAPIPLVLISPPKEYVMDFMTGWPDFLFAHIRQPVDHRTFRRATTWV